MKLSTTVASIVVLSLLSPAIAKGKKKYGSDYEIENEPYGLNAVVDAQDYGSYNHQKSKKSKSKKSKSKKSKKGKKYGYKKNPYGPPIVKPYGPPVVKPYGPPNVEPPTVVEPSIVVDPTVTETESAETNVAPNINDGTSTPTADPTDLNLFEDSSEDAAALPAAEDKPDAILSNGFKLTISALSGLAILFAI